MSIETPAIPRTAAPASALPQEFLTFRLGDEEYGVDILTVQEIRSYEQPTRMVNAPTHILGVLNLRGVIVPVVDMRLRFSLHDVKYDKFTVTIVLNVGGRVIGIVVDSVSDVSALSPEQMRPTPEFSGAIDSKSVLALGSVGDRMLILLDIERVMSSRLPALESDPATSTQH